MRRDGKWRRRRQPADGEPRLRDLVLGRLQGLGGPRVLLLGHTDTVFLDGTAAGRPFRIEDNRALGPGVSEMKGSLLTGFFAVEALLSVGFGAFEQIVYLC